MAAYANCGKLSPMGEFAPNVAHACQLQPGHAGACMFDTAHGRAPACDAQRARARRLGELIGVGTGPVADDEVRPCVHVCAPLDPQCINCGADLSEFFEKHYNAFGGFDMVRK